MKEYLNKNLLLLVIWIKCKKVTLMWGKYSLGKNDPWTNIDIFVIVACSKNILELMTSYDIIFVKRELAQPKVSRVLVLQNFS
jgi:hypothetical protein